ncbi:hypothetical protein R0381_002907 [Jeongeupia wiesaeckerbachi]|uniref:leucine-rich repeat domain-containing protein n=1 Tax=Jeongeupia wiesaeckerbachi TaxID=3051218 RepID=UPI003D807E36
MTLAIKNPAPVKNLFPDIEFAKLAAEKISAAIGRPVTVEDEVTQDELDQVKDFVVPQSGERRIANIAGIGYLKNLEKFLLESQNIEVLPDELAELTNLNLLILTANHIRTIPHWIGNLTELTRLSLDSQVPGLSGEVPESLGKLTKLAHLSLHNNFKLSGKLPDSLAKLTSLEGIPIQTNAFEDLTVLNKIPPTAIVNAINQSLGEVDLGAVAADGALRKELPVIFVQAQTEGDYLYERDGIKISNPDAAISKDRQYIHLPTDKVGDQEVTLRFASHAATSITYKYAVE